MVYSILLGIMNGGLVKGRGSERNAARTTRKEEGGVQINKKPRERDRVEYYY